MTELGPITPRRLTGAEPLTDRGKPVGTTVHDFWAWSASDLLGNTARGVLAEFIVARALAIDDGAFGLVTGTRPDWAAWDLTTPDEVKVEVKSSAYVQTWTQQRLSTISFSVRKTLGWNPVTGLYEDLPRRHADVYVFAVLTETDQTVVDPLQLEQWEFYVLPTWRLDERARSQHSITLPSLRAMTPVLPWAGLAEAVKTAFASQVEWGLSRSSSD